MIQISWEERKRELIIAVEEEEEEESFKTKKKVSFKPKNIITTISDITSSSFFSLNEIID